MYIYIYTYISISIYQSKPLPAKSSRAALSALTQQCISAGIVTYVLMAPATVMTAWRISTYDIIVTS